MGDTEDEVDSEDSEGQTESDSDTGPTSGTDSSKDSDPDYNSASDSTEPPQSQPHVRLSHFPPHLHQKLNEMSTFTPPVFAISAKNCK